MARIAEGTCATCHTIRPKNEMREVAVSRRVGTRYGISHSRNGNRESASAQYRRQHVWVCKGCRAPKSDGLIRWKFLILVVIAIAAYGWYVDNQRKTWVKTVNDTAPAIRKAIDWDEPSARDGAKDDAAAVNRLKPTAAEKPGLLAGIGSTIGNAVGAPSSFEWDQDTVRTATIEALNGGKARRWKVDGVKGQAVPSSATTSPGTGECRNVYQTAKVEGETLTSPTVTWCRADGEGQWEQRG